MNRDHFRFFRIMLTAAAMAVSSFLASAAWNAPLGLIKDVAYIESYVSNVTVNGSSVVNDKIASITVPTQVSDLQNDANYTTIAGVLGDETLWGIGNHKLTNTIVMVTDDIVTNVAISILEPTAKESVETAMTEMLGSDWKTKYGTGAAGIIAAILAAIAYLKKNKQDKLVGTQTTGQNIKTINGDTILGSGDVTIEGGSPEATDAQIQGDSGAAPTETAAMITPRRAPYAVAQGLIHEADNTAATHVDLSTEQKANIHNWLGTYQLIFEMTGGGTRTFNFVCDEPETTA